MACIAQAGGLKHILRADGVDIKELCRMGDRGLGAGMSSQVHNAIKLALYAQFLHGCSVQNIHQNELKSANAALLRLSNADGARVYAKQ